MHSLVVKSRIKDYTINSIDMDSLIELSKKKNILTIIDKKVYDLYPYFNNPIMVECIENNKNLNTCIKIYEELINRNIKINHSILAIGGGIIQDLVGFCASTYCRGIEYILVPTTLLSQVDSCVGGKTSLNFKSKKNILGTFYPPNNINICTDFLDTLSQTDKISGFGEVYKFLILQNKIDQFSLKEDIEKIIFNSLKYKCSILEIDEFDKKERKFLNFGHTFGHALESCSEYNIPHGIAVILGSMIACNMSVNLGFSVTNFKSIMELGQHLLNLSKIQLLYKWFDFNSLVSFILSDKKNTEYGLNMILIKNNKPIIHHFDDLIFVKSILEKTVCDYLTI